MPSKKNYNSRFPPARIKKIMQMDEEVGKVAAPVPVIISRVLEMFVEHILKSASMLAEEGHCRTLLSSHLSQALAGEERLQFLMETVRQHCKSEGPGGPEETPSAAPAQRSVPTPAVVSGVEAVDCTPAKASVPDALGTAAAAAAAAEVNIDRGERGGRGGRGRGGGGGRGGKGTGSSTLGSCAPTRGERGRGKPRGRPSKRSIGAAPTASQTLASAPVKRSRGRPRKNADPAPTSFPIPILPSPSSSASGALTASSTGGITLSIGGSAPTTPLSGGIGLSIPALSTTCTPAIAGVSISIPGFSFPSPSIADLPSPVDAAPHLDQHASQYKNSSVTFSSRRPLGGPLIAAATAGKGCPSVSPAAGVTLSFDTSSPCSDALEAKNDLPLSGASSSIASGVKVAFGGQAGLEAPAKVNENENNSVDKKSSTGVFQAPRLAASVASLAVEKSLDKIKIEVPAYFSYTSGCNSPGVITSSVVHPEARSCVSSKSPQVTDMEVNVAQVDEKNNEVSDAEASLKKHIDVKFEAGNTAEIIKKETKNSSRMKENDGGKLVNKDTSSIKSGIPFINGSSPKDGEARLWGCQAPPPLPALYSCSGMFLSSKVEDNSDEDYDN